MQRPLWIGLSRYMTIQLTMELSFGSHMKEKENGTSDFLKSKIAGKQFNSIDFLSKYQSWESTDPFELFEAPTIKAESNPKAHVCKHLQEEARGCDYLVLWLHCDPKGDNICFEVVESAVLVPRKLPGQQAFRAKFFAITERE